MNHGRIVAVRFKTRGEMTSHLSLLNLIRIGDMIGCADDSLVDKAIGTACGGKVRRIMSVYSSQWQTAPKCVESTMANFGRVAVTDLDVRLKEYQKSGARLWWFRLSDWHRMFLDVQGYREYLLSKVGEHYNCWDALWNGLKLCTFRETATRGFSSEIYAHALMEGGVLPAHNPAAVNPHDLVRAQLWAECTQLCGEPAPITDINTVSCDDWAEWVESDQDADDTRSWSY